MADRSWLYGDPIRGDGGVLCCGWPTNRSGLSTSCSRVRPSEAPWDCLRLAHDTVFHVSGRGGDTGFHGEGGVRLCL